MTGTSLRKHFDEIKATFFPRWDREGTWRVRSQMNRAVHGYCDTDRKTVFIVHQHDDCDERDRLFIHEICHAVAGDVHAKVWQRRMEQAAVRAASIGRDRLADLLREQVAQYQELDATGISEIESWYIDVHNWLFDVPDVTLQQVKRDLARKTGYLLSEIPRKFNRLEAVFQEAKQRSIRARNRKPDP